MRRVASSSQRALMLAGEPYDPYDAELVALRERARDLCRALNATGDRQGDERRRILVSLLGSGGDTVKLQPPFHCDYGAQIELGENVFFNFDCVVLDVCRVRIGSHTQFGPAVQIYTPLHPLRRRGTAAHRIREAGRDRRRRLGRRRRDHPARHSNRLAHRDRRRQRRHARCTRWRFRGGESVQGYQGSEGLRVRVKGKSLAAMTTALRFSLHP